MERPGCASSTGRSWPSCTRRKGCTAPFPKRDLLTAGLKIEKLSLLPQHLNELLDLVLEVQLKTKGDHQNSFLNKRTKVAV